MNKGLIYIFTGEGKGKTSAAIGVATRALLIGNKVIWIAFYKEESWGMAEKGLRENFENLEMQFVGKGFYFSESANPSASSGQSQRIGESVKIAKVGKKGHIVVDKTTQEDHKQAAESGLKLIADSLKLKPFLLVADEILNAVSEGLLKEEDVIQVLEKREETHLVMTGRGATKRVIEIADLVTECKKVKHPYDKGELAVRGLDY